MIGSTRLDSDRHCPEPPGSVLHELVEARFTWTARGTLRIRASDLRLARERRWARSIRRSTASRASRGPGSRRQRRARRILGDPELHPRQGRRLGDEAFRGAGARTSQVACQGVQLILRCEKGSPWPLASWVRAWTTLWSRNRRSRPCSSFSRAISRSIRSSDARRTTSSASRGAVI